MASSERWCTTTYVVKGEPENLDGLERMLLTLSEMPSPGLRPSKFGPCWLGNVAAYIDESPDGCDGVFYDVRRVEWPTLEFKTRTKDKEPYALYARLCVYFAVDIFYEACDFSHDYWVTNDLEREFFRDWYITIEGMPLEHEFTYYRWDWLRQDVMDNVGIDIGEQIDFRIAKLKLMAWARKNNRTLKFLKAKRVDK